MKHRDAGGSVKRNKPGVVPTPKNTLGVLSPVMARPKEIPGDVVRLTVTLPATTRKRLERKAKQEGKSVAALIRDALEHSAA